MKTKNSVFLIIAVSIIIFLVSQYPIKGKEPANTVVIQKSEHALPKPETDDSLKLFDRTELREYKPIMDINSPLVWLKELDLDADGAMEQAGAVISKSDPSVQLPVVVWADGNIDIIDRSARLEFPITQFIEIALASEIETFSIENTALGDGFIVHKIDSSSSLIYWDGENFQHHWLGD